MSETKEKTPDYSKFFDFLKANIETNAPGMRDFEIKDIIYRSSFATRRFEMEFTVYDQEWYDAHKGMDKETPDENNNLSLPEGSLTDIMNRFLIKLQTFFEILNLGTIKKITLYKITIENGDSYEKIIDLEVDLYV